jgi:hypothetical protein
MAEKEIDWPGEGAHDPFGVVCKEPGCSQYSTGRCTECDKMYCTDHLNFMGYYKEDDRPIIVCQIDKLAMRAKVFEPLLVTNINTKALDAIRNMSIEYVENRLIGGRTKDIQHYIFEEAIKMTYGADVWERLNKLPDVE